MILLFQQNTQLMGTAGLFHYLKIMLIKMIRINTPNILMKKFKDVTVRSTKVLIIGELEKNGNSRFKLINNNRTTYHLK